MVTENTAPNLESVLERMKKEFPATPDQLIPLLQFVQNEFGFLPTEPMVAIANYLRVPASHVYGVATFYAQFRFKPLGKNRITCCRGTACHVRGSARIIEELEKELAIKAGETTPDLEFSLDTVACIGSCALAPVLVINDKVYGKATTKRIKQIIDEIKGKGSVAVEESPAKEAEGDAIKPAAAKTVSDSSSPSPKKATKKTVKKMRKVAAEPRKKAAKTAKKSARKVAKAVKNTSKRLVKKGSAKQAGKARKR